MENSVTFQSYVCLTKFLKLFLLHLTMLPIFCFYVLPLCLTLRFLHTLTAFVPKHRTHIRAQWKKIHRKKKEADETDTAADRIVNLTQKMEAPSHRPPATPLPLSLFYLSFCQCPPPPPFLFSPWNPFHIIKDTQMKWTLRKSGFQQGGGCRGGGGWEAESWGIGSSRSTPPRYLPPSLLLDGGPPWREAEWLWPQYGSISSPLLISKAHYFVLRLAAGQGSSGALSRPTAVSFLPLRPTLAGHLPGP